MGRLLCCGEAGEKEKESARGTQREPLGRRERLPTERPAAIFVWFVPSARIFQAKAVLSWEDPSAMDKYNVFHVN